MLCWNFTSGFWPRYTEKVGWYEKKSLPATAERLNITHLYYLDYPKVIFFPTR